MVQICGCKFWHALARLDGRLLVNGQDASFGTWSVAPDMLTSGGHRISGKHWTPVPQDNKSRPYGFWTQGEENRTSKPNFFCTDQRLDAPSNLHLHSKSCHGFAYVTLVIFGISTAGNKMPSSRTVLVQQENCHGAAFFLDPSWHMICLFKPFRTSISFILKILGFLWICYDFTAMPMETLSFAQLAQLEVSCQESAFIYTLEAPYTQGPTSLLVNTGASWMRCCQTSTMAPMKILDPQ